MPGSTAGWQAGLLPLGYMSLDTVGSRKSTEIITALENNSFYKVRDSGGMTTAESFIYEEGHAVRRDLAPKAIRRDLELSLKTMGTEYVDVYYTHWQCKTYGLVPIEETMEELLKMKQEGKIRAIGASNTDLQILRSDYIRAGQLDVIPGS